MCVIYLHTHIVHTYTHYILFCRVYVRYRTWIWNYKWCLFAVLQQTELPDEWGIEELELVLVGPNGSKDSRSLLANLLFERENMLVYTKENNWLQCLPNKVTALTAKLLLLIKGCLRYLGSCQFLTCKIMRKHAIESWGNYSGFMIWKQFQENPYIKQRIPFANIKVFLSF